MNEFNQKSEALHEFQEILQIQKELDEQYKILIQKLLSTLQIQNNLNMYKDSFLQRMLNFKKVVTLKFEDKINEYRIIEYEKLPEPAKTIPILELIRQNQTPIECQFDDPSITNIQREIQLSSKSEPKPEMESQTVNNKLNTNCPNDIIKNRKTNDAAKMEDNGIKFPDNEKKTKIVQHPRKKCAKYRNRKYTASQIALINKKTSRGTRKSRNKNNKGKKNRHNKKKFQTRIFSHACEKASKNY